MNDDKNKQLFFSLIYSFQMQAMIQLGKLTNPVSNKTEKELDGAQVTIDMLDMLKAKTKNNVGDDEIRFLDQVIADLKLNFVEERDKEKTQTTDKNQPTSSGVENDEESMTSETETKEKPLNEQIKDDEKKSVPPQE